MQHQFIAQYYGQFVYKQFIYLIILNQQLNKKQIHKTIDRKEEMSLHKGGIQQKVTLQRTLKWLDKTEGRDKLCKMIQYGCRYLKYRYNKLGNKQLQKKVDALFCAMRDARKLFRLLKSIKQYGKILELIRKKNSMPATDFVLNILSRLFFLFYWFFDNLNIIAKLGLLKKDPKLFSTKASTCWFIALVADLLVCIKNIIINIHKITYARPDKSEIIAKDLIQIYQQPQKPGQKMKKIQKVIYNQMVTLFKIIGDMLPAGQGCQFYYKAFKVNVNQGWCGIGGFVSAFLTSYNLYYG